MAIKTNAPPQVESFAAMVSGSGSKQHPSSLQVARGTKMILSWRASSAEQVELTDPSARKPQRFPPMKSTTVTAARDNQVYTLVAIAGSERSKPVEIHVSTHADGEMVSTHAMIAGPPRKLQQLLQDDEGQARPDLRFTLTAGSSNVEGTTGPNGELKATIPSEIEEATLVLHGEDGDEEYALVFGAAPAAAPADDDD